MNEFVSIEILGTIAGCSAIITVLTQVFKKYLPEKLDAWLTSNAKFEYFDNRDYAAIEAYYFRMISYDLRTSKRRDKFDASYVLPIVNYEKYNQLKATGRFDE